MQNVEPEVEVLFSAVRSFFGTDDGAFRNHLRKEFAWGRVIQLASLHGVVPLLHEAVKQAPAGLVAADVTGRLRAFYLSTAAGNLARANELERLVRLLEGADIPVLSFKGLTLAQTAYGNLGLRGSIDLDILIRRSDYRTAEALLLADQYRLPPRKVGLHKRASAVTLWVSGQCPFVAQTALWSLDVHTAMMPPGYRYPVRFETLYERSAEVPLAHSSVRVLSPEDLLQVLCFHGIKNRWEALKHVADVAALIRSAPGLDWEFVLAQAQQMGGVRILHVGLLMAHEMLGTDVPAAVLRQFDEDRQIRAIADHTIQHLLHSHSEHFDYKQRSQLHLSIQDNLANKLRYGVYTVARRLAEPLQRVGVSS